MMQQNAKMPFQDFQLRSSTNPIPAARWRRLKTRWNHSARMSKAFRVMMLHDNSKFPSSDVSKTAFGFRGKRTIGIRYLRNSLYYAWHLSFYKETTRLMRCTQRSHPTRQMYHVAGNANLSVGGFLFNSAL